MMSSSDKASAAAATCALKKKEQLKRANALRSEREAVAKHDSSLSSISRLLKMFTEILSDNDVQ
jgi:hypothetical protein